MRKLNFLHKLFSIRTFGGPDGSVYHKSQF